MKLVSLHAQPDDMERMSAGGGLLIVAPSARPSVVGQLVNHAEFGDLGPIWICVNGADAPEYLESPDWPREPVTELVDRVVLRMPERISLHLSLERPAEALRLAPDRGAGAILLDCVPIADGLEAVIRDTVLAGCLVVLVTPDPLELSMLAGDEHRVCDPEGRFISPAEILGRRGASGIGVRRSGS
ncbi:hypothetical protein [Paracoccus sp. ME4]|uniref:hypothetical protein n=1 Tax=Paracoccus sp. ME4 TaxID=3138066 RepID=UPI00398B1EA4